MSSLKKLKKSKGGTYYIEIDASMVEELEAGVGDLLHLATEDIWMYDRKKKVCKLRVLDKQCYDSLIKNLASNRDKE